MYYYDRQINLQHLSRDPDKFFTNNNNLFSVKMLPGVKNQLTIILNTLLTTMMKSFRVNDSRILPKLVMADAIDQTVFNTINEMDSMLVFRAILFNAFSSP